MRFEKIEFKNLFAYGEQVQTVEYSDSGKMTLLKGISGSGKSAILNLPILVLYGKPARATKSGIANRTNKHGWIRGVLYEHGHQYVIEREFSPNSLKIWKDDQEVDIYGSSAGEDYIKNEIIEIPQPTFTNMVTISMKRFKSFLTMSPTERKQVVDEVFDVRVINLVFDMLKKDAKEIGNSINGDNQTLFSLNMTLQNATSELTKMQEKSVTEETRARIEENNKKIEELNSKVEEYTNLYKQVSEKQTETNTAINDKRREVTECSMKMRTIREKLGLFSQSKCPTCGTPFEGELFDEIKKKLDDAKKKREEEYETLSAELTALTEKGKKISDGLQKVNTAMYEVRVSINQLLADNRVIEEKINASGEYTAVQNIIDQTTEQLRQIKDSISTKTEQLQDLQRLQGIYSIDGVTKQIINNYIPLLNDEIAENLLLVNFPYSLTFDEKFEPSITEMGQTVPVETLSDGEETRINIVILTSLLKLLLRRYSSINILTLDETVSTLDTQTSEYVLAFLRAFADENNLNCFVVSHTDLSLDYFDDIIEVEKINGFSTISKRTIAN